MSEFMGIAVVVLFVLGMGVSCLFTISRHLGDIARAQQSLAHEMKMRRLEAEHR